MGAEPAGPARTIAAWAIDLVVPVAAVVTWVGLHEGRNPSASMVLTVVTLAALAGWAILQVAARRQGISVGRLLVETFAPPPRARRRTAAASLVQAAPVPGVAPVSETGPSASEVGGSSGGGGLGGRPPGVARTEPKVRRLDEGWFLRFDDGRELELGGLALVGRNPEAVPGEPDADLVTVAAAGVSKLHFVVGVDRRGVFVIDRDSTNGTALVNQHGDLEPCPPHVEVRAREGQVVSFSDRSLVILRR